MKNQKMTRFEVGMPVMVLYEDAFNKGTVTMDNFKSANMLRIVVEFESQDERTLTQSYTLDGKYSSVDAIPCIYTLPEYEALKKLTDSFVDGTFGSEPKEGEVGYQIADSQGIAFRPTIDEVVIYDDKELNIESMYRRASIMCVLSNRVHTAIGNLSPVIGYQYANGFCIPLLKEGPKFEPKINEIVIFEGQKRLVVRKDFDDDFCTAYYIAPLNYFSDVEGNQKRVVKTTIDKLQQTDIEQPETTDLLDENGHPVYFEVGQEVGCLMYGKGKVSSINQKGYVSVSFYAYSGMQDYSFDGANFESKSKTLYPIEQYNAITLPKLKPIQVAKLEADVISLPSWFKGGAIIHSQCVSDYFWDNYNDNSNILESFGKVIAKVGAEGAQQLTFYGCKSVNDGIKIEFTFNSKFYGAIILYEVGVNEEVPVTAMYDKNGKHITEIL